MSTYKVQIRPLLKAPIRDPDGTSTTSSSSSPEDSEHSVAKKTRTSKPKARSGCVTCKFRHVKCDETKPECNRCTSTGRKCDGYVIKPRKKRKPNTCTTICKRPSNIPEISQKELNALDYFHHKTAPALSSYFDSEFWTRLVFQMSYVEPSIRHAMTAVAALHQVREESTEKEPNASAVMIRGPFEVTTLSVTYSDEVEDRFAITQYNRAISHLSKRMDEATQCAEVALLACILFICVEFLRGDCDPVVKHFRAGMNIALSTMSDDCQSLPAHSLERIKCDMVPILNRIDLLSTIFGYESPWEYPVDLGDTVPDHFASVREARNSIVHVLNLSIRFIKNTSAKKYGNNLTKQDYAIQAALRNKLTAWGFILDEFVLSETMSDRDLDGVKLLHIHQLVVLNWLARCTLPKESACDGEMNDFEAIVTLAEDLSSNWHGPGQRSAQNTTSSSFLFDIELVSPMYYVATSCRHPVIRRRAIAVLKQTPRREGLWDSNMSAAVAERLMNLEEVNMTVFDGSELPAEKDRIHRTNIISQVGKNPKHHSVDFHALPHGLDKEWKMWTEEIILS